MQDVAKQNKKKPLLGEHWTILMQCELHDMRLSWQSESWMPVRCRELMVWDLVVRKGIKWELRAKWRASSKSQKLEKDLPQEQQQQLICSSSASRQ